MLRQVSQHVSLKRQILLPQRVYLGDYQSTIRQLNPKCFADAAARQRFGLQDRDANSGLNLIHQRQGALHRYGLSISTLSKATLSGTWPNVPASRAMVPAG